MKMIIDIAPEAWECVMLLSQGMDKPNAKERPMDSVRYSVKHGKVLSKHHGRLIDADALREEILHEIGSLEINDILTYIDYSPTVVEGSEDNDNT